MTIEWLCWARLSWIATGNAIGSLDQASPLAVFSGTRTRAAVDKVGAVCPHDA
jgi:hypothetical protein